jgi:hypothetical protein
MALQPNWNLPQQKTGKFTATKNRETIVGSVTNTWPYPDPMLMTIFGLMVLALRNKKVCRSVPLVKDTTALDEKKAPHSPCKIRESKRNYLTRTRIVTEEKGLPPSTPEGQPNPPDVARIPGPQEQ